MNFRIKKIDLLFFMIISLILIGAMNKYVTFTSIIIVFFVSLGICIELRKKKDVHACIGIVSLLLCQNLCIGLGAHLSGNTDSSLRFLTQIPFMVITIIWFLNCVISKNKIVSQNVRACFSILLLCILVSAFIGIGTTQSAIVTFRNLTVFYMAYEISATNCITENDRKALVKQLIQWGCVLCICGLMIQVGGYSVYRLIGIHEVYIAKAAPFAYGTMEGRFYTSLFSNTSYFRMGSILYEPINLSYYLAISLICAIFENPWKKGKRILTILCIGLGLLLSFGKGGYLIVILSLVCYLVERLFECLRNKIGRNVISTLIVGGTALVVVLFVDWYVSHIGLAVLNHIFGITRTWINVLNQPWGYGLGTGGNVAQTLGNAPDDWFGTGGETAYLSFMYQIGVQGIIIFTLVLFSISYDMKLRHSKLERVLFYLPFILLGVSILQDNTFTPQCIVAYMFVQGAFCKKRLQEKYN